MNQKELGAPAAGSPLHDEYHCDAETCGFWIRIDCGLAVYGTCPMCRAGAMRRVVFPEGWAERMKRAKAAEDAAVSGAKDGK